MSNIIGPNTYGGLRNRSTNDDLMQQNFTLQIINTLKQPSRIISLDSSKFYDRIYPNLSSITMKRLGLHNNISIILARTLIHTQHSIKTSYGLRNNYIQNNTNQIAAGVGQGNSSTGPSWLSVASLILDTYRHKITDTIITSPDYINSNNSAIIGYIDDNNIIKTYHKTTTFETITNDTKNIFHHWKNLLEQKGGIINVKKSKLYVWKQNQLPQ